LPVGRTLVTGSPYVGVYLRVSDGGIIAPLSAPADVLREAERVFGAASVRTTVQDCEIVGSLVALNSRGAVVGGELDDSERLAIETLVPVQSIRSRQNALGNNVLVNDQGAVVHPEFSDDAVERIGRALGVPAQRGTVAGLGTVGMAASATNRGVVVHPRATDREIERLAAALKVPVHRSTANFGVPVVGACLAANSRGLLVGRPTTPVEIVHLQEGFQLFD